MTERRHTDAGRHLGPSDPIKQDVLDAARQCRHGMLADACEDCRGMTRTDHRAMELLRIQERQTTRCKDVDCRAWIIWTVTEKGKRMPVNVTPDPTGTFRLALGGKNVVQAIYDTSADEQPRYTSHFATCPAAAKHRSRA